MASGGSSVDPVNSAYQAYIIFNSNPHDSQPTTEDQRTAKRFVSEFKNKLNHVGLANVVTFSDCIPGHSLFEEHSRFIENSKKIFIILTPEFYIDDEWNKFLEQSAFFKHIEEKEKGLVVTLSVGKPTNIPERLRLYTPVYFNDDWQNDTVSWNRVVNNARVADAEVDEAIPIDPEQDIETDDFVDENGELDLC